MCRSSPWPSGCDCCTRSAFETSRLRSRFTSTSAWRVCGSTRRAGASRWGAGPQDSRVDVDEADEQEVGSLAAGTLARSGAWEAHSDGRALALASPASAPILAQSATRSLMTCSLSTAVGENSMLARSLSTGQLA